jgi:hypothetical protein
MKSTPDVVVNACILSRLMQEDSKFKAILGIYILCTQMHSRI